MANRIEPEAHIDMRDQEQPDTNAPQQPDSDRPAAPASAKTGKPIADTDNDGIADTQLPAAGPDVPDAPAVPDADTGTDGSAQNTEDTDVDSKNNDPAVVIQSGRSHRLRHWLGAHKKVVIPVAAAIALIAILAAVPSTRYAIAGTVIKQQFAVTVVDSQTGKPVTSAAVSLKGVQTTTDNQGRAILKVPVGKGTLMLDKHFYKSTSQPVLVPLRKPAPLKVSFVATGRQVPVTITNKITGKPVANATLSAEGTQAITDKSGEATIVLPANKEEAAATITAGSYNRLAVTIKITTSKDSANTFQAVPAGKIYFLSNAAGTVDVVKTDLDGANRQTVLKGTGKEDKDNTVLLAAQSWRYLALLSKRDGGANAKLYLIDTSNDALSTMDEGDAVFNLVGWSGTTFVYQVNRQNKQPWDTKAAALKSYDAATKKIATLDETNGSGTNASDYFHENYANTFILNNEVVFIKNPAAAFPYLMNDHLAAFYSIKPDGSGKKTVKTWTATAAMNYTDIGVRADDPNSVYVADLLANDSPLFSYQNGQMKAVDGKKAADFWNQDYVTYLFAPSNKQTLWGATRDGKNTLFVGDADGKNEKQLAALTDYQTFGWYTDDYVLLSKNGSELYIAPAAAWGTAKPLKVTDYFKPNFSAPGYGKGYGGF